MGKCPTILPPVLAPILIITSFPFFDCYSVSVEGKYFAYFPVYCAHIWANVLQYYLLSSYIITSFPVFDSVTSVSVEGKYLAYFPVYCAHIWANVLQYYLLSLLLSYMITSFPFFDSFFFWTYFLILLL